MLFVSWRYRKVGRLWYRRLHVRREEELEEWSRKKDKEKEKKQREEKIEEEGQKEEEKEKFTSWTTRQFSVCSLLKNRYRLFVIPIGARNKITGRAVR